MARVYGYARVSTIEQDRALQHDALTGAGCARIFTDHASGKLDRRPQLEELMEVLQAGDTVVVWRLDRLGRSLKHLIAVVAELGERGVGFRSLTEAIDTHTDGGRSLFPIMGALAEFERHLISERTHAGLAAARARGRVGGRPPALNADQVALLRQLYDQRNRPVADIATSFGISRATVYRYLDGDPR